MAKVIEAQNLLDVMVKAPSSVTDAFVQDGEARYFFASYTKDRVLGRRVSECERSTAAHAMLRCMKPSTGRAGSILRGPRSHQNSLWLPLDSGAGPGQTISSTADRQAQP